MSVPASDQSTTALLASLNAFDWFLLAILAYSIICAFLRGLILELFSLAGLLLGLLLAAWNYSPVAAWLSHWIHTKPLSDLVAFLLIAIGVMVLVGLIGKLVRHTAHALGLGFFDRICGALFGLARGLILGVVLLTAGAAFLPSPLWIAQSRLSPYFLSGAHAVSFVVPSDLQQRILNGISRLKHTAPDWIKQLHTGHNRSSSPHPEAISEANLEARTGRSDHAHA